MSLGFIPRIQAHDLDVVRDRDLIVVGAGAKAAAIAAKVHTVNVMGLAAISLAIVETASPGASWFGLNGGTSGDEPLAITPMKDVGFPYRSTDALGTNGKRIDDHMLSFSWQRFLVSQGRLARWVDAGSPPVRHREYGEYLVWVLSQATEGIEVREGRVTNVDLIEDSERWSVGISGVSEDGLPVEDSWGSRALVITGPGKPRSVFHDPSVAARLLQGTDSRARFADIPSDGPCDVAIVGGGDSAISCTAFLRAFRPNARLTVYTSRLPMGRSETFLENRVFSTPEMIGWSSMPSSVRREFVGRCDRGVFDPLALESIAYDDQCAFVMGRVAHLVRGPDGSRIGVVYENPGGACLAWHEYAVNCTGSDMRAELDDLVSNEARIEVERRTGCTWDSLVGAEAEFGHALEIPGLRPSLHVPALAALSQGPGFANLGCLGTLADRVTESLLV